MTTTAPPPPSTPGVPIFGRHSTPIEERTYRRFGLEVEDVRGRRYFTAEFDVHTDVDGGSLVTMLNARTQQQQANATIAFLAQELRDDDGVPQEWTPPAAPEEDDENPGEWMRDDPTDTEPEGAPLYRWHDDALMTEEELREAIAEFDPLTVGSSRRRFAYLSDSPYYRYRFEAIQEVAEYLTKEVVGRPTLRPTPSGRGPQRTRGGSVDRSGAAKASSTP